MPNQIDFDLTWLIHPPMRRPDRDLMFEQRAWLGATVELSANVASVRLQTSVDWASTEDKELALEFRGSCQSVCGSTAASAAQWLAGAPTKDNRLPPIPGARSKPYPSCRSAPGRAGAAASVSAGAALHSTCGWHTCDCNRRFRTIHPRATSSLSWTLSDSAPTSREIILVWPVGSFGNPCS